ncbi:MAG: ubiquinone/menaquinone biosynthesis methyltransferase [Candidatus Omnitrophica bacterium]|nr:ubiquinone/menaquinone biosynthesis methyltransferase [Candidatus Omnitrophota bacterium]
MSVSSPVRPDLAHPDRKTIQSLFNAISPKYDFLNSFLSFGLHVYWRRKTVRHTVTGLENTILDLGAGTGKSLSTFLRAHRFKRAVGCDFSEPMLQKAKKRLGDSAFLVSGDFHRLPFPDQSFDLVTGSFILRSVQNMAQFLEEVKRVLKPQGKAVFLELTRPKNRFIWKLFYEPYLKFCIPSVGQLFSRHEGAYQFLSQSIQAFVEPEDLQAQFDLTGFSEFSAKSLSFGAATIIQGRC